MAYFLLVFDRTVGRVLEQTEFADSDEAVRERFRREVEGVPADVEVVVLGAENELTLHETHSRYFGEAGRGLAPVG